MGAAWFLFLASVGVVAVTLAVTALGGVVEDDIFVEGMVLVEEDDRPEAYVLQCVRADEGNDYGGVGFLL